MGLLQKIKDWFTGGSSKSKSSSSSVKSANRITNYGGGGGSSVRQAVESSGSSSYRRAVLEQKRKEKEKKEKLLNAFKAEEHKAGQSSTKTKYEDPKQKIASERAEKRKKLLEAFHAETNNRYNVKGAKTQAEALKRRQAQKSQAFDADAYKFDVKYHPIASSLARGALSGVTFGGSELLAKYAPASAESREAENFYQQNKNKGAELAGEIAGSLVGFGITGGLSATGAKAAASKLAPRALEKATAGTVEKLAASSIIRKAAEKEAIKRFGAEGVTKELIAQIARRKAEEAAVRLGEDAAINLTTGAMADISRALIDSDTGNGFFDRDWGQFGKTLGGNIAMNAALGTATSFAPALKAGKGALPDVAEGVARNVDDVVAPSVRNADEAVDASVADARRILAEEQAETTAKQTAQNNVVAADAVKKNQETAEQIVKEQEDVSKFAAVDEPMKGVDPEAEAKAKKNLSQSQEEQIADKIEEKATGKKPTNEKVVERREEAAKAAKKEKEVKPRQMPKGEKLTSQTAKRVEGATFEEATKPASAKEIIAAEKKYVRGQASNHDNVVSRGGTSLTSAVGNDAELKVIKNKIDDGSLNYARVKNKEKYEWAVQDFVDHKEAVSKKMLEYADNIDAIPQSQSVDVHYQAHAVMKMMRSQLDNPALTAEEREAAREIYGAAASVTQQLSSMSGQINQFQGVMVHCDGKTRMRNAVDNIANLLDSSRGFRTSKEGKKLSGNAFQRKNQIRELVYNDPDAAKALEKIIDATTEEEYGNGMQELLYATSKMNRKTAMDYVQTWRYLAMLGNPKTHVRNVLGNITFGGIRQLSNTNRSFIEKALEGYAGRHGIEIERHGKLSLKALLEANTDSPLSKGGKAAQEWFEKNQEKILGQTKYAENTSKGSDPAYMKWLTGLSDINSSVLAFEDNVFRKRAYKESFIKSYDQYVRDGKEITDELLEKIHNSSLLESQVATFNEFNELAQVLSKWSHPDYNASALKKGGGFLVNTALPFTKVPSNILKQSINYSPLGVAKGFANITNAAKTGDAKLFNRAIDELASGLTGTGIAAAGFWLGKNTDWFTTNAGKEDYAAKFKKAQGVQNYSVTYTDPETGKATSMTLDWLVPTSATFFAGVEMANQLKRGYGDAFEFIQDMSQVISRVIEPVLETSMLSGLYNIVESSRNTYGDDDKQSALSLTMRELTQSYLNSLVPTVAGQASRTFKYKTDLQLTGEGDWEYWINSMKSKMGIANTNAFGTEPLGADTDAYGNVKGEKKTTEDYIKSGLKNFLSPANIQKVDLSELDREKIKMYEDAVKNGADPQDMSYLFPKKQYKKTFTVGDLDVKMSNKDLSTYNKAKTKGGEEAMRLALEGIMFNRYEKDENGKRTILKNGYTADEKQELIEAAKGMSMREIEQWLYEQPQFRSATEAEQRKVINHMWSLSNQGKSQGAKRVGEQAVIKAQGGDVNEYNFKNEITQKKQEALQPAIDAGIITYEEAVDFARHAGKTYYYENDEGGTASTYFNKKQMIEYLMDKGYSFEKAEALFNAFKASNAKPYSGNNLSSGRRGYYRRRYRRRGRGGGSGKQLVSQTIKSSAYKTKKFNPKVAVPATRSGSTSQSGAKALALALQDLQKVEAKIKPPKNK